MTIVPLSLCRRDGDRVPSAFEGILCAGFVVVVVVVVVSAARDVSRGVRQHLVLAAGGHEAQLRQEGCFHFVGVCGGGTGSGSSSVPSRLHHHPRNPHERSMGGGGGWMAPNVSNCETMLLDAFSTQGLVRPSLCLSINISDSGFC